MKFPTDEQDLENMFGSDSNQIDRTAWDWFRGTSDIMYTTLALEYSSWQEQDRVTDVEENFQPG